MFAFRDLITALPKPSYFLAAPTVRTRPQWYLDLFPDITQMLSKALLFHHPNLTTLKTFHCSPSDLESDGMHLNTLSGIAYVNFLVEQPK